MRSWASVVGSDFKGVHRWTYQLCREQAVHNSEFPVKDDHGCSAQARPNFPIDSAFRSLLDLTCHLRTSLKLVKSLRLSCGREGNEAQKRQLFPMITSDHIV